MDLFQTALAPRMDLILTVREKHRYGFRLLKSMHVPMQTDQAKRVLEEVASGAGKRENGLSFYF